MISANGVECDALDHGELIQFLRKCPTTVTLRLYRDTSRSQTPLTPDAAAAELDLDVNAFLNSKPRRLRHEAVEMVNTSEYGNMSVIFTDSGHAARRFERNVQAGMLGVNVGVPALMAAFPFSGWKNSFFGDLHTNGEDGARFFTKARASAILCF